MKFKEVINVAVDNNCKVEISYRNYNREKSIRQLSNVTYSDESGNQSGSNKNYISAFCHLRNEQRTFKLNRIEKIRLVDNSYSSEWVGNPSFGDTKKSGCYIATMAYGNYEHPQVIVLRKFRDDVLQKYLIGRIFVKIYYFISPKIVLILKENHTINRIIRKMLDKLIKNINQYC